MVAIASKSACLRLSKRPPKLRVVPTPTKPHSEGASTEGGNVIITRGLLPVPVALRAYFLAHELGHVEGGHHWITFGIVPMVLCGIPAILGGPNSLALRCFLGSVSVFGIAVGIAYIRTMIFEWDADRRGARLTSVAQMLQGIVLVQAIRPVGLQAFYANKAAKLQGTPASIWMP